MNTIYYIMGVSGSGKSTIGQELAMRLNIPFFDGDDFHPESNIQKMKNGQALNDQDRLPWLQNLQQLAQKELKNNGAVIASSALKQSYRDILEKNIDNHVHWIYLEGNFDIIHHRMKERSDHFMPAELLQSQFDALEVPKNAITISILAAPDQIIDDILKRTNMQLSEFGVIGLGVMGKSLSLNLAEKGFRLSLFNRHETGVEENIATDFIASDNLLDSAQGFDDLSAFVQSLDRPRKILLMIKAGPVLDHVIAAMQPNLEDGDIIIDGGNSHYKDTKRRIDKLEAMGIHFIGSGVSGGEEGARRGPSIMPGGSLDAYKKISPFLEAIAAKDKNGGSCCAYVGSEGAGHFVKMVHNGIEYAEMQLLAEAYGLLRFGMGKTPDEIADVFESWRSQRLDSYLLEITIDILRKKENEHWLIDKILDQAGNKGTGSWTTIAAAELGEPITMITAALFARYTSSFKSERVANSETFNFSATTVEIKIEDVKNAYHLARLINHHQGIRLIQTAGTSYHWQLNLSEIARIWTNGCIIRSQLMEQLIEPLRSSSQVLNFPQFKKDIEDCRASMAIVVKAGIDANTALPCFSAANTFLMTFAAAQSTANIIQAQRDYFGAHTYRRNDDDDEKAYHTKWK